MSTRVQVRFRGQFREQFREIAPEGILDLVVEGRNQRVVLADVVRTLVRLAPGDGASAIEQCAFFVDGSLLGENDGISDGAIVHVLSPVIGG